MRIFTIILLALLPLALQAQTGGWIAVTRSGDTLRNVHLWGNHSGIDSIYSFKRAEGFGDVSLRDSRYTTVSNPSSERWVDLRDVILLSRERPSYFWPGLLIGGGVGLAGGYALSRDAPNTFSTFLTMGLMIESGMLVGGSLGALLGVDETYDFSESTIDEVRMIATVRLPQAEWAGPDGSLVAVSARSSSVSRRATPMGLWFVLGAVGIEHWDSKPISGAGHSAICFRLEEHLVAIHGSGSQRGDQMYNDLALHYGRAFTFLDGESYISAGAGYAWGGATEERNDPTQEIAEYGTFSASALFQQQWLITRWFALGGSLFVGANSRFAFGGTSLTFTFGDLD